MENKFFIGLLCMVMILSSIGVVSLFIGGDTSVLLSGMSSSTEGTVSEVIEPSTTREHKTTTVTTVKEIKPIKPSTAEATTVRNYSEFDLEYLTIAIYTEAGGDDCSDETRLMVGNVVLNRVKSNLFPDSISEVLLQKGQYGTFYWTGIEYPSRAANEEYAVNRARKCAERLLNGERVLPDNVVYQSEFSYLGSGVYKHTQGFYFNYQ